MNTIKDLEKGNASNAVLPPLARAPFIIKTRSGPREPSECTQWPRIGGLDKADLVQNPTFDSDQFRKRYAPRDDAFVYVCGSPGTMDLGRCLRLPLYKVGVSQTGDLLVRQRQISADAYGGYRRQGMAWVIDPGFDCYEMQTSETSFALHAHSPVSLVPRGLRVRLPSDLTFRAFHDSFNAALASAGLNHFLMSAAGRRHLALLDQRTKDALRYTKYQWGGCRAEYRLANEISICRPRQDFSYIAIVIERLILKHVLALPAS